MEHFSSRASGDKVPVLALDPTRLADGQEARCLGRFLLLSLIVAPMLLVPVLLVASLMAFGGNRMAQEIVLTLNNKPADIAIFGDSVIRNYSECEAETDGIDDYLQRFSGRSLISLEHNGYTSRQFGVLSRLFGVTRHKPKVVVIPINMRVFSVSWGDNPAWQFGADMQYVRILAGDLTALPRFVYSRLSSDSEQAQEDFLNTVITANGHQYGTLGSLIDEAKGIPLSIECEKSEEPYRDQLKAGFISHYLYDLSSDDRRIGEILGLVDGLKRMGIVPIVYITPVNYQDGVKYTGEALDDVLKHNVATLSAVLDNAGVDYLDLSMDLPATAFADKGCACEHLAAEGRKYVAGKVAEHVRNALKMSRN
jgi:hypothetical protein